MQTIDDATNETLKNPAYADQLRAMMTRFNVPESVQDGLVDYITQGVRPGSFLEAVIDNDLREACGRADLVNRRLVYEIVTFMHNHAPAQCWGREDACRDWQMAHGARRLALMGDNVARPAVL